jgi:hypothetical protein
MYSNESGMTNEERIIELLLFLVKRLFKYDSSFKKLLERLDLEKRY